MENENNLAKVLKELHKRLEAIEQELNDRKIESPQAATTIHLHVQEVKIQNLNLDELAYHIGSIDISELSGMLNLGNTFSPSGNPKKKKDNAPSGRDPAPEEEKPNPDEIQIIINGKKIIPEPRGRTN